MAAAVTPSLLSGNAVALVFDHLHWFASVAKDSTKTVTAASPSVHSIMLRALSHYAASCSGVVASSVAAAAGIACSGGVQAQLLLAPGAWARAVQHQGSLIRTPCALLIDRQVQRANPTHLLPRHSRPPLLLPLPLFRAALLLLHTVACSAVLGSTASNVDPAAFTQWQGRRW